MKDGGPAYPCKDELDFYRGMSLRDWFAGQALIGIIYHYPAVQLGMTIESFAATAYRMADFMLAERDKQQGV